MDYTALVGGAVLFQAGDSVGQVRSINVVIVDDILVEGNEFFFVSGSVAAALVQFVDPTTVTVNIQDNDCKSCKSLPMSISV